LKDKLGIESELVASHGGVFEVSLDGKTVFSKKAQGRFPDDGEVVRLIGS
jgi:selenoprotein W-related protein